MSELFEYLSLARWDGLGFWPMILVKILQDIHILSEACFIFLHPRAVSFGKKNKVELYCKSHLQKSSKNAKRCCTHCLEPRQTNCIKKKKDFLMQTHSKCISNLKCTCYSKLRFNPAFWRNYIYMQVKLHLMAMVTLLVSDHLVSFP